jgi:hypothetical protein
MKRKAYYGPLPRARPPFDTSSFTTATVPRETAGESLVCRVRLAFPTRLFHVHTTQCLSTFPACLLVTGLRHPGNVFVNLSSQESGGHPDRFAAPAPTISSNLTRTWADLRSDSARQEKKQSSPMHRALQKRANVSVTISTPGGDCARRFHHHGTITYSGTCCNTAKRLHEWRKRSISSTR